MNQEHKLLHGSLCSFSLTKLQGYEANRVGWTGQKSRTTLYGLRESNNVKLYRIFRYRESFEIQKWKRSLENFTQLKTGIISVFENAIRLPADALIVLADTIRRPKNFFIVFFDEKDKIRAFLSEKMAFQYKIKHKTKSFSERNEKRTWEIREGRSRRYFSVS